VRNERARKAMVLWGYGYTYAEIGERLGTTEKAVERMIDYGRKQVRKGKETA
jgi:DNA-directed RNA polymerase specialized sigma24 family protein